ncbi:hypothetical protein AFK62_20300 (plasmid) [Cronobacter condimenti 1330]|uniref:Uncharacterized protein n=1 Tax=Cronobacter condimenti 1330 TaxID=1073999 RepID=A0ABM5VI88_9ENTR|nr:hypothetical protein AFK62_20300 [Cronobacter condimenti 1330]
MIPCRFSQNHYDSTGLYNLFLQFFRKKRLFSTELSAKAKIKFSFKCMKQSDLMDFSLNTAR